MSKEIELLGLFKPQTGEKLLFAIQNAEVGSGKLEIWWTMDADNQVDQLVMYAGKDFPDNYEQPQSSPLSFEMNIPTGMDNSDFDTVNFWFKDVVTGQMFEDLMELYMLHNYPHLENQDLNASVLEDGELVDTITLSERQIPN